MLLFTFVILSTKENLLDTQLHFMSFPLWTMKSLLSGKDKKILKYFQKHKDAYQQFTKDSIELEK